MHGAVVALELVLLRCVVRVLLARRQPHAIAQREDEHIRRPRELIHQQLLGADDALDVTLLCVAVRIELRERLLLQRAYACFQVSPDCEFIVGLRALQLRMRLRQVALRPRDLVHKRRHIHVEPHAQRLQGLHHV